MLFVDCSLSILFDSQFSEWRTSGSEIDLMKVPVRVLLNLSFLLAVLCCVRTATPLCPVRRLRMNRILCKSADFYINESLGYVSAIGSHCYSCGLCGCRERH